MHCSCPHDFQQGQDNSKRIAAAARHEGEGASGRSGNTARNRCIHELQSAGLGLTRGPARTFNINRRAVEVYGTRRHLRLNL